MWNVSVVRWKPSLGSLSGGNPNVTSAAGKPDQPPPLICLAVNVVLTVAQGLMWAPLFLAYWIWATRCPSSQR